SQGSSAIVAVALAVGLFTLFSMTKIWTGAFWGGAETEPERDPQTTDRFGGPPLMVLATLSLVAISISFSIWAGPIHELSQRAAEDLLNPAGYIRAVLGEAAP
ncbi:MAG: Na+/H+ antiporter subunit D, partial [Actinomycetota bacterium]